MAPRTGAYVRSPPKIVATVEGLYETLHPLSETDCLSFESSVLARRGPFANVLTTIPVRERGVEQNVCLLQRGDSADAGRAGIRGDDRVVHAHGARALSLR